MATCNSTVLKFFRGETFERSVQLLNKDGSEIDITGASVQFTVKKKKTDADINALILIVKTVHDNPVHGLTSFSRTGAQTATYAAGLYFRDIKVTFPDTTIRITNSGTLQVLDPVSD